MATTHPILRHDLRRQLARAAQVRSLVSMFSMFPSLLVFGVFGPILHNETAQAIGALLAIFGVPLLVSSLLTRFYCRDAVRCPGCGCSLWDCGTGNFKPRRMRVRDAVRECPGCQTPIV